jgi:hypothetical protein
LCIDVAVVALERTLLIISVIAFGKAAVQIGRFLIISPKELVTASLTTLASARFIAIDWKWLVSDTITVCVAAT